MTRMELGSDSLGERHERETSQRLKGSRWGRWTPRIWEIGCRVMLEGAEKVEEDEPYWVLVRVDCRSMPCLARKSDAMMD